MKYLSITTVIVILGLTTISFTSASESFKEQFERLSPREQAYVKAEATQKEDYERLPVAPSELTDRSVVQFCKLLPRGLETNFPASLDTHNHREKTRTELWARYLSCKDSILYYEGHRFFDSGHYTASQINDAIAEIKKVMNWIVRQEEKLDSFSENTRR